MGVGNIEKLKTDHRFAVLSVLGDDLKIDTLGLTIFQNYHLSEDVSDWKINERVETLIKNKLEDAGKIVLIPDNTAAIREEIGRVGWDDLTNELEVEGGKQILTSLANSVEADSILLIGRHWKMMERYYYTRGYGIWQSSILFIKEAESYVNIKLVVLEANSLKEIARTHEYEYRFRMSPEWIKKSDTIPKDILIKTKKDIETLIDSALEKTLKRLSLI